MLLLPQGKAENCTFTSNKMALQNAKNKCKTASGGIETSTNLTDFSRLLTRFVFGEKNAVVSNLKPQSTSYRAVPGYFSAWQRKAPERKNSKAS